MQVQRINQTIFSRPNFKGLWGDTNTYECGDAHYSWGLEADVGTHHKVTEKEYYPFIDETDEQIEKIKKENEFYKHYEADTSPTSTDFTDFIDECVVKIMKKIPVSAKTYSEYIKRELLSKAEMAVEDALKTAKLQRFLR